MPSLQPKCAEPVTVNIKAFSHIDLKQKRKPSSGGCLHHNKMKTKLITVIKHLQDPTSVVKPHGCCQVVIMSMQCLWMTQATSMTQRVFSSLPLKLHVNVWLCPAYKSFWASCISVCWHRCLDEPWGKTWQNMAKPVGICLKHALPLLLPLFAMAISADVPIAILARLARSSAISPVARPNGMTRLATEGHRFGFFCFSTVTSFILFLGCLAVPAFKEQLEHQIPRIVEMFHVWGQLDQLTNSTKWTLARLAHFTLQPRA